MDKVKRMLLKAKQIQKEKRDTKYIFWGLVFPMRGEWELTICYASNKENDTLMFKSQEEACDYVSKLAEEHGQEEITIICWGKDPNRANKEG